MSIFGEVPAPSGAHDGSGFGDDGWSRADSRAVVACDGRGNGVLVFHVGPVEYELEAVSNRLDDLGLDDAPLGLSIWEGRHVSRRCGNPLDGEDWESEAVGKFRPLSEEELRAVGAGRAPWDESEWRIPGHPRWEPEEDPPGGSHESPHSFEEQEEDALCRVCRGRPDDPIHGQSPKGST